jgi:hypothetical protein
MFVEELKNNSEWESFLQTSPNGTIYHSLRWKEVIQRSFPHKALYLTIKDANGRLTGICPGFIMKSTNLKMYCSTPYSDYGGPVITKRYPQQASLSLLNFFQNFCSEKGIAYAKICFMEDKLAHFFKSPLSYEDASRGTMELDLKATSSDFIWNKLFSQNTRRKIRLIERDGFQAQEAQTKSDLKDFYDLYLNNMKYIGALPYSYNFMKNMWEILYPQNLRIWLIERERRIGGMLIFKSEQKTFAAFMGIDRSQFYSKYRIFPFLIWKEIRTAEEEGIRYVSLGETSSDPKNPHHIQKQELGATFRQQKMVWYPFCLSGHILIQARAKSISAWKALRGFLPKGSRRIETIFSRF